MGFDLESYSRQAEQFVSEMDREYHLHYSGRQVDFKVEQVYDRHRGLFEGPAIDSLREAAADGRGERERRAALLLKLAVGGFMGLACAEQEAELARLETELELRVDGETIPYRRARPEQANEADPARRAAIDAARLELLEDRLNPLYREMIERTHALAAELGWGSYAEACAELSGIDLEELSAQTQRLLAATEPVYEKVVGPQLQRVLGKTLAWTARTDLARFFRVPDLDAGFPADRLVESFARTMAGLGLDLEAQTNIVLDTEERPTKTPRAYCAPVQVPQEVYLVVPRVGGREDYAAMFHEGGHAEHFANMDPALPTEFRHLGDNSVTESFAFLLEHLTEQPRWLDSILGVEDGEAVGSHARAVKLIFLRRFAAKIAYELELHGPGTELEAMPARYAALVGEAVGVEWTPATWLEDVDEGFYVACYLRAWALEAKWRSALAARFGEAWFEQPAAGEWLVGIWRNGQRLRGDELAEEVLGEGLDLADLAGEFI